MGIDQEMSMGTAMIFMGRARGNVEKDAPKPSFAKLNAESTVGIMPLQRVRRDERAAGAAFHAGGKENCYRSIFVF